jgi:hypothetical protein
VRFHSKMAVFEAIRGETGMNRGLFARTSILVAAVAACATLAAPAQADHDLVKIREVHNSSLVTNETDYVVLQMFAPAHNLFMNHYVSFWNQTTVTGNHVITANGMGTANQSTFLIANSNNVVGADDSSIGDTSIAGPGGAVCYEESNMQVGSIDCVRWGNFTGAVTPISGPAGTNAAAIPAGGSLVRSIAPGCPTLLEAADDTNNSVADFALGTPQPRNSAVPPTETACPPPPPAPVSTSTTPTSKKCKRKKKKRHAAAAKKKKKCKKKKKK